MIDAAVEQDSAALLVEKIAARALQKVTRMKCKHVQLSRGSTLLLF